MPGASFFAICEGLCTHNALPLLQRYGDSASAQGEYIFIWSDNANTVPGSTRVCNIAAPAFDLTTGTSRTFVALDTSFETPVGTPVSTP